MYHSGRAAEWCLPQGGLCRLGAWVLPYRADSNNALRRPQGGRLLQPSVAQRTLGNAEEPLGPTCSASSNRLVSNSVMRTRTLRGVGAWAGQPARLPDYAAAAPATEATLS
jgi:hypothetical protein